MSIFVRTLELHKKLTEINIRRAKALAVTINSKGHIYIILIIRLIGGSAVQCDIIKDKLKIFCKQYNLPLYTFAVGVATSGGFYLLGIGDKVSVSSLSQVGNTQISF